MWYGKHSNFSLEFWDNRKATSEAYNIKYKMVGVLVTILFLEGDTMAKAITVTQHSNIWADETIITQTDTVVLILLGLK